MSQQYACDDFPIGSPVAIYLARSSTTIVGSVRYFGNTHFAEGQWLGLELVPECTKFAKNNGSVQGETYFTRSFNTGGDANVCEDEDEDENEDDNSKRDHEINFAIFTKPDNAHLLSFSELLQIKSLSEQSKSLLINHYFGTLREEYLNLLSTLEKLQIEYGCVVEDREQISEKFQNLSIEQEALKLLASSETNTALNDQDQDTLLANKKLEIQLLQLREQFTEKEYQYIGTIKSLKSDILQLESKFKSYTNNDRNVIDDMNESEMLVEKLSLQNTELSEQIEQLSERLKELERVLQGNKELICCYEQTEKELNNLLQESELQLHSKDKTLDDMQLKLAKTDDLISKYRRTISNMESTNESAVNYKGFYISLLLTAWGSFEHLLSEICEGAHISQEGRVRIQFLKSLYTLKGFLPVIRDLCETKEQRRQWDITEMNLQAIYYLALYDEDNVIASKYSVVTEKIIKSIVNWVKGNDEANEASFIVSMSNEELMIDLKDDCWSKSFEKSLLLRELVLYKLQEVRELGLIDEEPFSHIEHLRDLNKGIVLDGTVEEFVEDCKSSGKASFTVVAIEKCPQPLISPPTIQEPRTATDLNSDDEEKQTIINNLGMRIRILEAKLTDERHIQSEIQHLKSKLNSYDHIRKEQDESLKESDAKLKGLEEEIENLHRKLAKYGISPDFATEFSIDTFRKTEQLATMKRQRALIKKLTTISSSAATYLPISKPRLSPSTPRSAISQIDSLFEVLLA